MAFKPSRDVCVNTTKPQRSTGKCLDSYFIFWLWETGGESALRNYHRGGGQTWAFCRGNSQDSNGISLTFSVTKNKLQAKKSASGVHTQFLFVAQIWACDNCKALLGALQKRSVFFQQLSAACIHCCSNPAVPRAFTPGRATIMMISSQLSPHPRKIPDRLHGFA